MLKSVLQGNGYDLATTNTTRKQGADIIGVEGVEDEDLKNETR